MLLLSACGLADHLPLIGSAVVADLEVFNRTQIDIFLIDADGKRLDVPACGSARDRFFRIDNVRVRTESGYIRGFGGGDHVLEGQRVFVIEVPTTWDSTVPTLGSPDRLPPCDGLPQVQVGV